MEQDDDIFEIYGGKVPVKTQVRLDKFCFGVRIMPAVPQLLLLPVTLNAIVITQNSYLVLLGV